MHLISIVAGCYNEEENVEELCKQIKHVFAEMPQYQYELIFTDNASIDNTVPILRKITAYDKNVKVIVNMRNFGPGRSAFNALLQTRGDAIILMAADLQDPPSLIKEFLQKWGQGSMIVTAVKYKSEENKLMFTLRKGYYKLLKAIGDVDQIENFTGFGLYDKTFIQILKKVHDPNPYFRGLVAELGYKRSEVFYTQPRREKGKSSHSFYLLYDIAMLGLVNYSKIPLRLASFVGFGVGALSLFIAIGYFVYKLIFWNEFSMGMAPLVIGLFFFASVQLFFIGIIGEYIGAIYTQVKNRPLVIEKERINFD